jgi:hypothetical protein
MMLHLRIAGEDPKFVPDVCLCIDHSQSAAVVAAEAVSFLIFT